MNVCISGYFDPLHVGHLEYIRLAKTLAGPGGILIVIVNNDHQATLKKGKPFMKDHERVQIIAALKDVDEIFLSIDTDRTVCRSLARVHSRWSVDVFANGGDQSNENIPENETCHEHGIMLIDNLGEKIQSSSWLTGLKQQK
jgi:cytidyltransferase-like protein